MNKKIIISAIIAAIVIPAGVYALSPLFINTTIDEKLPETALVTESEIDMMMESDTMMKETDSRVAVMLSGAFVGVGDGIHDAQGHALVVPLEEGQNLLRLEDFRSTNGPDLYVYLASDTSASDYVSLGRLKANNGNQNYDIPAGTDLAKYDTVLIWCKQFSVLFGSAELA